ncbi:MAG TPA: hypothetical protein VGA06_01730 [Candidatus Paceibacterota bacterium]|jgi:hypothetical protein
MSDGKLSGKIISLCEIRAERDERLYRERREQGRLGFMILLPKAMLEAHADNDDFPPHK